MADSSVILNGRVLIVAFEGWNDAGEAASGAVRALKELLDLYPIAEVESEDYFDYQFNRPIATTADDGSRLLVWPSVTIYGPTSVRGQSVAVQAADSESSAGEQSSQDAPASGAPVSGAPASTAPAADGSAADAPAPGDPAPTASAAPAASGAPADAPATEPTAVRSAGLADDAEMSIGAANVKNIYLLLGTEPSRGWKSFTAEILQTVRETEVSGIVMLGAMLADVPHTRPISVFVSSENALVRKELEVERSTYEGPVGILSVLGEAAEKAGIPTLSIWASVPHYVHNAPSPKATLALIDKLEEIIDVVIPRGDLVDDAATWESGIDALASEDEDMSTYIEQLEQARDTVDSPEASGEAIAQEFEKYLRGSGDEKPDGGSAGEEPWRPKE